MVRALAGDSTITSALPRLRLGAGAFFSGLARGATRAAALPLVLAAAAVAAPPLCAFAAGAAWALAAAAGAAAAATLAVFFAGLAAGCGATGLAAAFRLAGKQHLESPPGQAAGPTRKLGLGQLAESL